MSSIEELQNATENIPLASDKNNENISTLDFKDLASEPITRQSIEKFGNSVRMTDKDENTGLELYCYNKCDELDDELLQQCRGVVFNGEEIVMRAFPYTIEISNNNKNMIYEKISPIFKDCRFFDSHEGALIRMFYFSEKWYICTHRKLNAFRSKWASKDSFGTSFKKALENEVEKNEKLRNSISTDGETVLENFQAILDKEKQYMFLVRNTKENRIVCASPPEPCVYHVGTFIKNGVLSMDEDINIPYSKEYHFNNIEDMIDYTKEIDIREYQGLIIFAPNNKQYKILNEEYIELFKARGNEPSIKFRYLQVRMNQRLTDALYHLYPEHTSIFNDYENALYAIAKIIYNSYVQRHIKQKWSQLPNEEYAVDKACHQWHERDQKNNRVKLDKVIEVLNEQHPTSLNKMIRRYLDENSNKEEIQQTVKTRARSNTFTKVTNSLTMKGTPTTSPILLAKPGNDLILNDEVEKI